MRQTYREFRDIEIPDFVNDNPRWLDYSWHNDAAARSEFPLNPETDSALKVWVFQDNPSERELDMPKFIIEHVRDEAEHTTGEAPCLYQGDDADLAAQVVRGFLAMWSEVGR